MPRLYDVTTEGDEELVVKPVPKKYPTYWYADYEQVEPEPPHHDPPEPEPFVPVVSFADVSRYDAIETGIENARLETWRNMFMERVRELHREQLLNMIRETTTT